MRRFAYLAAILLAPTSALGQAVVVHVHIHVHIDGRSGETVVDDVAHLERVLDTAVMTSLEDNPALKDKLVPIKARVGVVRPRTERDRKALDALKARIRAYERDIREHPHAREYYEHPEPQGDNDDLAGVAAG